MILNFNMGTMLPSLCKIMTIIAVFQLILISISIYKKKISGDSKFILIILLLSFSIFLAGNFIYMFKGRHSILELTHLGNLFVFLSAPLLYLFILPRIDNRIKLSVRDVLHFVPFVIVFVIMWLKIYYLDNKDFALTKNGISLIGLLLIQNIIYLALIYNKLKNARIYFFKTKKQINNPGIRWYKKLFVLFATIIIIQSFVFIFCNIMGVFSLCMIAVGLSFITTFFLVNNIILFALSNPIVFEAKSKYQNTPIKNTSKAEYLSQLKRALDEQEVYLDPLLSLEKLSKQINVPKHCLSQIINDNYSLNFNELINKYRIIKVTEKLKNDPKGDAIISIAYEVGFNAKSTFNTAFKKFTKMTPSQYVSQRVNHESIEKVREPIFEN